MNLTSALTLLAGIGLFLYGMDLMGQGLKNAAGASLEKLLERLTNNRIKGAVLGTGVTCVIQSSAATCIMCLGFINAGVMTLTQAIPVAMGANLGSTITGQILRLGDIASQNIFLTMLKPSSFAPLLIAYGVIVLVFIKSRRKRINNVATVLLGLGILFVGMSTMENTISPLKDDPSFQKLFTTFSNPLVGILFGALVTAIIQSSSASVGILQALTSTGVITWRIAFPVIMGQNIGKCITVWLGSLNASKDSKRLTLIHFLFNIIGTILFSAVIYGFNAIFHFTFWDKVLNRGNVADFHSLFNLVTMIVLLPFTNQLAALSRKVIKDKKAINEKHRLDQLDDLLLKTPSVALESARKVTIQMGYAAKENFEIVSSFLTEYDPSKIDILEENERFLDQAESKVSDYLVRINNAMIGNSGNMETNEVLRAVSDFERIGDYDVNIYHMINFDRENNVAFSAQCMKEIEDMVEAIRSILSTTVEAYENRDRVIAARVEPLQEVISSLKELMQARHIERLKNNQCSVQAGISLIEFLNNSDRISGHCSNIAIHTIRSLDKSAYFDTHDYLHTVHNEGTEEYKALYHYYESKYYEPMASLPLDTEDDSLKPEAEIKVKADQHSSGKHGDKETDHKKKKKKNRS